MLDGGQRACLLLMRGLSPAKHILTAKTRLITMRSQPNCFEVIVVDDGYDFSLVNLFCIQNASLVQCLELCGGGGWWCKVIFMSNPTSVEVKLRRVDAVVVDVTIFSRKT